MEGKRSISNELFDVKALMGCLRNSNEVAPLNPIQLRYIDCAINILLELEEKAFLVQQQENRSPETKSTFSQISQL